MLRSELIAQIQAEEPDLKPADIETMVNAVFEEIICALEKGDRVELRGFGAFSIRRREARQGRNPRTGDTVKVPAKAVPFFKPGKDLRAKVDEVAATVTKTSRRKSAERA